MKKMILGLAALIMVTCSFAQPSAQHHRGPHSGMEFKKLNLSAEQQQQMKTLNEDFRKQMQLLNNNEAITVKEQRDQREALVKAHKQKMESLLTNEQKNQLVQIKAERDQKREERAVKQLDRLKEKLALTDEQVATIKSNEQKTHNKIEAIMKDEKIERADKKQQLMTLKEEMKNNIDNVLTQEQKTKMDSLRKERQEKMKSFRDRDHRLDKDDVK
jgi:Spy/CpxP family protein refolding chaperone